MNKKKTIAWFCVLAGFLGGTCIGLASQYPLSVYVPWWIIATALFVVGSVIAINQHEEAK